VPFFFPSFVAKFLLWTSLPAPLRAFVLRGAAFMLLWHVGYTSWLAPDGHLDEALSRNLAQVSAGALRWVGIGSDVVQHRLVQVEQQPAVWVGNPCNGLVLYALFAGFVLAFPGSWKRKSWFIPLGLIYLLNIGRVAMLAVLQHWGPAGSVDFNHHYTFTVIVYGAIAALWTQWVQQATKPAAYALVS
jgi:exosortase/archaeosortase family protein